jgi:hypothetical protein
MKKPALRLRSCQEAGETVLAWALLLATSAILVPRATAQQCGYNSPNPVSYPISSAGPSERTYDSQDWSNCDLLASGPYIVGASARGNNGGGAGSNVSIERLPPQKPADLNREIYFRNKVEFSQDVGWLPINIPFPFDFMLGGQYQLYPLKYTLVPVIGSLRWQIGDIRGPLILRGNWEVEASLGVVAIPRGPETHYFTYIMGMRRNFVPRNWRVIPYFDWRAGLGYIDAKGPLGVPYAQGQDFTFTLNMGSGLRYNFSPRYAVTVGLNWMHISNANLSEHKFDPNQHDPWGVENFGINVYGPMFGVDIQLRKHPRHSE